MSDVPIAQGLKHCSLGDTEACLPRALCSPGWKQLISNCLHSNYLIVQKHCLVFQFSLSHCLPEGLFTALSLIWVGGVPVGEVNCQDRKNTMVARSRGAGETSPWHHQPGLWILWKQKFWRAQHFHLHFFVCQKTAILSTKPWITRIFPPFSLRGFLSSLIFPVYSTFPLLVILKPRVLWAAAVHSRKFHYPEGLGISEGPWMKDYTSACELEQLCF